MSRSIPVSTIMRSTHSRPSRELDSVYGEWVRTYVAREGLLPSESDEYRIHHHEQNGTAHPHALRGISFWEGGKPYMLIDAPPTNGINGHHTVLFNPLTASCREEGYGIVETVLNKIQGTWERETLSKEKFREIKRSNPEDSLAARMAAQHRKASEDRMIECINLRNSIRGAIIALDQARDKKSLQLHAKP